MKWYSQGMGPKHHRTFAFMGIQNYQVFWWNNLLDWSKAKKRTGPPKWSKANYGFLFFLKNSYITVACHSSFLLKMVGINLNPSQVFEMWFTPQFLLCFSKYSCRTLEKPTWVVDFMMKTMFFPSLFFWDPPFLTTPGLVDQNYVPFWMSMNIWGT